MSSNVALYYPYIHFRNWAWIKVAALYWPRVARIVLPVIGPTTYDQAILLKAAASRISSCSARCPPELDK